MKRFEIYKYIRKRAIIFGLPIFQFAIMMVSIIASLLVIIFSFNFWILIGILLFNSALYLTLLQLANNPQLFQIKGSFPKIISNKRNSTINYE